MYRKLADLMKGQANISSSLGRKKAVEIANRRFNLGKEDMKKIVVEMERMKLVRRLNNGNIEVR